MAIDAEILEAIRQEVQAQIGQLASGSGGLATTDASYTSGNLLLRVPGETAAPTKTDMIVNPYSSTNLPAANDKVWIQRTQNGKNRVVIGEVINVSALPEVIAQSWFGMRWVKIGADITFASANTERNTASTSYVTVKRFRVERPGKYRVTMELARSSASTAQARLAIEKSGGIITDVESASISSTHPTFTPVTLDYTVNAMPGDALIVQLKSSSGDTVYIQSVVFKGSDETGLVATAATVVTD